MRQTSSVKLSIWLTNQTIEELAHLAAAEDITKAELIRKAVLEHIDRSRAGSFSMSRIAETVEYIQLCLQYHLIDEDEDKHERIVEQLEGRLVEYHGR